MEFLLPYLPVIIPILVILIILLMGYVKAPPDQAYIISGLRKNSRILIGQAGIRIPFLERLDKLYLGQMTAKALLSMQEDLAGHLQRLQQSNEKALRESLEAAQRILDKQQQEGGCGNRRT